MLATALLILLPLQADTPEATQNAQQDLPPLERVVTRVGEIDITLGDVRAEVNRLVPMTFFHARLPEEDKLKTYKEALNNLVERNLIHLDAQARGITASGKEVREEFKKTLAKAGPEYAGIDEAQFDRLLEQYHDMVVRRILIDKNEVRFTESIPEISEEAIRARYDMIAEELFSPEEARFQHILCKVPPSASRQEGAAVRKEVEALRQRALDGEDFGELAKEFSDDIYASVGGDMGFIQKGAFSIRELDKQAFELKDTEVSVVMTSLYGFHILKRVETRAPRQMGFDEVAAELRIGLEMEASSKAREAWMTEMRETFGVEELIVLEDDSLPVEAKPGETH